MDGIHGGDFARTTTLVIVGAGFSGTALALALLRDPPPGACRIVLVERTGRFGCGLAYAGRWPNALLNVPAGRMSVDERRPQDFCEYLGARGLPADGAVFAPRAVYGEYLAARLQQAAVQVPRRLSLERITGSVVDVAPLGPDGGWCVRIGDGRSVLADGVVLALGHQAPARVPTLRALEDSRLYVPDPWQRSIDFDTPGPRRVLLVGTGLTMADTVCQLMDGPCAPRELLAVSRRGLLSRPRLEGVPPVTAAPTLVDLRALRRETTTRGLVRAVRAQLAQGEAEGTGWRAVIAALRDQVPDLWHRLDATERRRFVRHVQPYWDVHRHQLPPAVGRQVARHVASGTLRIRAARIVASRIEDDRALVTLRARGRSAAVEEAFDLVVNCSGPDTVFGRGSSPLVQSLLRAGLVSACETGTGIRLDAAGRPLGRAGEPAQGLFYLGPWARARDLEATAVQELRAQAIALAGTLRTRLPAYASLSPAPPRALAPARAQARRTPGPSW